MTDITTDTCIRCEKCDHYSFMVEASEKGMRLRCLNHDCSMVYGPDGRPAPDSP